MKQQNIYKTLTIVLLLLNLGTIGFFWMTKPPHPPMPGEGPRSILEGLSISESAVSMIEVMEKTHHENKRKLVEKDRTLHEELFKHVGDKTTSDSLVIEISNNIREIESMTIDFFNEIYDMCDEKSKAELKERIMHGHKMMRGPGGPPKP
ncbi:MAG: hypothetical protein ACO2Z9_09065 [Crocinitomicaceae bacterium]